MGEASEAEAVDLRLMAKADAILGAGGLTDREREFVEDVRNRKTATLGRRKRYRMSASQIAWFWSIAERVGSLRRRGKI
jgi:hypothetical protein